MTVKAFSGISPDATVIVTSIEHDGITRITGMVYNEPFAVVRNNYGDAIEAGIKRALENGAHHFDNITEAFRQIVEARCL